MPKFIYTIITALLVLMLSILGLVLSVDPKNTLNKALFSFLFILFISLLIPLFFTILKSFKSNKEDLNTFFKNTFKENLAVSIVIGILYFFKTLKLISFNLLLILSFLTIIGKIALPFVKKPRKKLKY